MLVEIVLCSLVVRTQGTLIRPTLIYLLPVGRAILLLGERMGLLASLLVWVAYAVNILPGAWPDHLGDFPNYLSFFMAPYAVAVICEPDRSSPFSQLTTPPVERTAPRCWAIPRVWRQ